MMERIELARDIEDRLGRAGFRVTRDNDELVMEAEPINASWWLGKRTVTHRAVCRFDESSRTAILAETAVEKVIGIAPPTFSVEKSGQSGKSVTVDRTDHSLGGGGRFEYGKIRELVEQAATRAGWAFRLQLR